MDAHRFDEISLATLRARPGAKWQNYDPEVLPLWVAEMDFPLADPIKQSVMSLLARDDFGYPQFTGLPGLREAVCARLKQRYDYDTEPDDVMLLGSTGAGLNLSVQGLTEPGDEVLLLTPLYPPFKNAVERAGRVAVEVELANGEEQYEIDFAALERAVLQPADEALQTICAALIAPAVRISNALSASVSDGDVQRWLAVERDDPGAQDSREGIAALTSDIAMARGQKPPSIGYTIGQLWRKWQNDIRAGFNPADLQADTASAIVNFDEGLKRFSYGPPVAAAEEFMILINQGLVRLNVVDDPDIILEPTGWRLADDNDTLLASVMIDAVLPSPDLDTVTDPLVVSCQTQGMMHPVQSGLGAVTAANGELISNGTNGLCMLGRLTLGSVIAADSLHDCFGQSTHRWANSVFERQKI